jgi:hypothetical protein
MIFTSGLQKSYIKLKESLSTGLLRILRDFCPTERQAIISGKFNRPLVKTYTGQQLYAIDRVVCEEISPVLKTYGGRLDLADKVMEKGLIRNAREYINLINTGEPDAMFDSEMSQIILVKAENEDLREGKSPIMLACDDHRLHYLEHIALVGNPAAREDTALTERVMTHAMEHYNQFMTLQVSNPGLLAWIGETPLPMPMQPMMPGQPQQPGQQKAPSPGPTAQPQQGDQPAPPRGPGLPGGADQVVQDAYQRQQEI